MAKRKPGRASPTDKAIGNLLKWSSREEWADEREEILGEHLGPACEDFDLELGELREEIGPEAYGNLLGFAMEDLFTRRLGPEGRNIVDDYLKRRSWNESWPGKCYLAALRDSVPSLYEVTDLEPGSHLVLRDLVREGPPVRVEDRLGSESAAKWDRLGGRALDLGDKNVLAGGLLLFPFEAAELLLRVLRKAVEGTEDLYKEAAAARNLPPGDFTETIQRFLLAGCAPAFTRTWLTCTLERLRRPLPQLTNFEGEKLLFSEVRFPLTGSIDDAEARLDGVEELERAADAEANWVWLRQETNPGQSAPLKPEGGLSFGGFAEGGAPILGNVELREGQVILSVNSAGRAERGKEFLSRTLGGLIGPPRTSFQTPEQALERPPAERPEKPDLTPEEAARIMREHLDGYYRKVLSEPVPALDGQTPRQAARSGAGRGKVIGWLKRLENNEIRRARRSGSPPYDFGWVWEELGLGDLRR